MRSRRAQFTYEARSVGTAARRLTLEHGDILPLEEIVSARFVLDAQAITGEDS